MEPFIISGVTFQVTLKGRTAIFHRERNGKYISGTLQLKSDGHPVVSFDKPTREPADFEDVKKELFDRIVTTLKIANNQ